MGLEPSCVVVCPEQAIVCGDLDDPSSQLSQLIKRHPVQVRKPEKGTKPKLFYIDGDEASLVPSRTKADGDGNYHLVFPARRVLSDFRLRGETDAGEERIS